MAKGRFLSRSISMSEQVARLSLKARLLFTWILAHLDVDGRTSGNPRLIKTQIVPLCDEIPFKSIRGLIAEFERAQDARGVPLALFYEVGGQQILWFPGFEAHQQGLRREREAPSKFPPPSADLLATLRIRSRVPPANSGIDSRTNSGVGPAQEEEEVEVQDEVQGQAEEGAPPPSGPRSPIESLRDEIAAMFDDGDRAVVALVVGRVREPQLWLAEISAALRTKPPASVAKAIREWCVSGNTTKPSLRQFNRYLEQADATNGARSHVATRPTASGNVRESRARGQLIFSDIRELIESRAPAGHAPMRFIARDKVARMGAPALRAYDAVGGANRVLAADGKELGFLINQFCEAFAAAEAEHATSAVGPGAGRDERRALAPAGAE